MKISVRCCVAECGTRQAADEKIIFQTGWRFVLRRRSIHKSLKNDDSVKTKQAGCGTEWGRSLVKKEVNDGWFFVCFGQG